MQCVTLLQNCFCFCSVVDRWLLSWSRIIVSSFLCTALVPKTFILIRFFNYQSDSLSCFWRCKSIFSFPVSTRYYEADYRGDNNLTGTPQLLTSSLIFMLELGVSGNNLSPVYSAEHCTATQQSHYILSDLTRSLAIIHTVTCTAHHLETRALFFQCINKLQLRGINESSTLVLPSLMKLTEEL